MALKPGRGNITDGVARLMLNKYAFRDNAEIVGKSYLPGEKVTLYPVAYRYRNDDFLNLELRIGTGKGRKYVVKDILALVDNVRQLSKVTYGKQLEFIHSMDSFDEKSKNLMRFVVDRCEEQKAYNRISLIRYSSDSSGDKRKLALTPSGIDRLFAMYTGDELEISLGLSKVGPLSVVEGDPTLKIQVESLAEGAVALISEPFGIVCGEKRVYIQMDSAIYSCSEEYSEKVKEFLRAMEKCSFRMTISSHDLSRFCANVLPTIQGYFELGGDTEAMEEYMPLHLESDIYLDAPEKNIITAKLLYRYGDKSIDFYALHFTGGSVDVKRRDLREEMSIRVIISKYFQFYDTNNKVLRLEANDEELYRFVDEGIPALMRMGSIHVTDRFQKVGMVQPPTISVGVRLNGNLLDLDIDTGEFPPEELAGVLNAYRENLKYYRLTDGRYLKMEETSIGGLAQIADGLDLGQNQLISGTVTVPSFRSLYLDKVLRENAELRFNRDAQYKALVRNMKSINDSDLEVPSELAGILRNYQKTGYRWMKTLERYQFAGILADDMGLGKTLQVIALFLSAKREGINQPSLVVCPTSLALNWVAELGKFAPSLSVINITGDTTERKNAIGKIGEYDIVLTSYELLKRDKDLYKDLEFHYQVIDEAQYIKNHFTQNARAVKSITSKHRFALTGTPIENRLSELWSIFDFLIPGYLYNYTKFRKKFENPAIKNGDDKALTQLRRLIAPFVLRRIKSEVLSELPPKTETTIRASMEGDQRKLYVANLDLLKKSLAQSKREGSFEKNKFHVFAMLTKLRQICCDPSLCYEDYDGPSAKLDLCMELVNESVDGNHRVLIFSQFTSMLSIIEKKLQEAGISYYVLKGDTPKERRAQMVERFNVDNTQVFLISLKAGGTGLNLTGADVVIHYDPWWNIAAQNQASDRAHRIGQKNSVQVYKIIINQSIEEKILKLQETKSGLVNAVIGETDGTSLFSLTAEELLSFLE